MLARHHRIPFYVVAPWTTIDPHCRSGAEIPLEQRDTEEIRGVSGAFGSCCWAPVISPAENPAFDVTPAELVTAWTLGNGVYTRDEIDGRRWWEKKKGRI